MSNKSKKYLDYWYSRNGNLGSTKSFGHDVWLAAKKQQADQLKLLIENFKHSDHITHIDDFIKELEGVLDESN